MFTKILSLLTGKYPPFRQLTPIDLPRGLKLQLNNKIYYTPRIQKLQYSMQLSKYMNYLQRKKQIKPSEMKQMVNNILIDFGSLYHYQQIQGQLPIAQGTQCKYGLISNFYLKSNPSCPYHGQVDWLVYTDQTHFFPIMFFSCQLSQVMGVAMAYSNMITKYQLSSKYKVELNKYNEVEGTSLITNGHQWQIFKVTQNFYLQKSIVFQAAETKDNKYKNIYSNQEMIAVSLGIIHFCLGIKNQQILALEKIYQYIDEQKYMVNDQDGKLALAAKLILKLKQNNNNKE